MNLRWARSAACLTASLNYPCPQLERPDPSAILTAFDPLIHSEHDINEIGRTIPIPRLHPNDLIAICHDATRVFKSWPVVLRLSSPVCVIGDLHGNLHDLIRILRVVQSQESCLFLGDYVDRGSFSVEVTAILFALVVSSPTRYFLLRGNHECVDVTATYGFKEEVVRDYGNGVYSAFMKSFVWLPLAAIIDCSTFCVHGGIGPNCGTLAQIEQLERPIANSKASNIVSELLWSDPVDHLPWFNSRTSGGRTEYGKQAVRAFLEKNELNSILRAHQCVNGVQPFPGMPLATVFSSSAYDEREPANCSGIVRIPTPGRADVMIFDPIVPLSRMETVFVQRPRTEPDAAGPAGEARRASRPNVILPRLPAALAGPSAPFMPAVSNRRRSLGPLLIRPSASENALPA